MAGDEVGVWVRQPIPTAGYPWFALGMRDRYLSTASARIIDGAIIHEATQRIFRSELALAPLGSIISVGPTHHLIGHVEGREAIGAFAFEKLSPVQIAIHPSLWAVDTNVQTSLLIPPTHNGQPVVGGGAELDDLIATRSDLFISRVLGMGSQSLAAAMTETPMLGGRAWTSLLHPELSVKRAVALWLNSILGMLVRLGYAQTTQPARTTLGVKAMAGLPIPNFAEDSDAGEWARLVADEHFNRLAELELEPAAYAWRDLNRHQIDWIVLEMLGIDAPEARQAVSQIRELWCREPSVHGGNRSIMRALGIEP